MACHAVDKKLVGPSYKDVAAKYAGQKDAVDKLAQKVVKGGAGVWGAVPMPANPQVSEAEAKQLVQWILTHEVTARVRRPLQGPFASAADRVSRAGARSPPAPRASAKRLPWRAPAVGVGEEALAAFGRDELHRAAGPGRKADAEDRADVGVVHARQHAFGQAARRLDRLPVEQAPASARRCPPVDAGASRTAVFSSGHSRFGSPAG